MWPSLHYHHLPLSLLLLKNQREYEKKRTWKKKTQRTSSTVGTLLPLDFFVRFGTGIGIGREAPWRMRLRVIVPVPPPPPLVVLLQLLTERGE